MPGTDYNAGDIVNKTLFALRPVPVYRSASDSAQPFGNVATGQPVGVVYSWLSPAPAVDRSGLWWAFYDGYGIPYYVPHEMGAFDVRSLRQQGVISVAEKVEQEKEDELNNTLPWYDNLIRKYGKLVVFTVIGAAAVKGYFSRKT